MTTVEAPTILVTAKSVAWDDTAVSQKPAQSWSASTRQTASKAGAEVQAKAEPTDEELIAAICDGQQYAIEMLYDRYRRYTFSLAYHILRDPTAAEDIVQEAFLSIWRKAGSYQPQHGSVLSWLQAIVHHRAIDKVRAAAHRDCQWIPLQEQDPPGEQPDVWEQAWRDEQHRMIRTALDQIPAEQRLVIELAYFGGYSHAEIAEQWHIPLGTVKGRIRLGLQKMRTLLAEQGLDFHRQRDA